MDVNQDQSPSHSVRRLSTPRVMGALSGIVLIVVACAWLLGGGGTRVLEEQNYKCALTGTDRTVMIEDGVTVADRVTSNDVSNWASANGIPGLIPGQAGWELASTVTTRGSEPPRFGEGLIYLIPVRLYSGSIAAAGKTRDEALRSYQQHLLNLDPSRRSLQHAMEEWLNQAAE
ncbi:hypothetical protein [Thalassoglobus neptunius]|nr:hypothetical protein [Thalassoglobus neptunius]